MILTIDIGNTNVTCALFDKDKIVKRFSLPSDTAKDVIEYTKLFNYELGEVELEGAIIGSVVEELNKVIQYVILAQYGVKAHILSSESKLPIKISVPTPSELGADRIANSVRGYELYKNGVIVVDFGTATTFDIVNSKGEYIGGLIAPGVGTQLKSLYTETSKLPKIEPEEIDTVIGNTTKDAILVGVVRGSAGMVDSMIQKVNEELKVSLSVVLTGGFSEIVSKYMAYRYDILDRDLTLEGLSTLFYDNKPKQPIFKMR